MGATKLMTAAGGGITLDAASTASDKTITVPARTGNMAVDGPAFSAYSSVAQTGIANTTWTKQTYDTEEFDTNSNFASSRFTPTVAGYYQCSWGVLSDTAFTGRLLTALYKNGSGIKNGPWLYVLSNRISSNSSALVYLNGSTDYVEVYAYSDGGTWQTNGGAANNFFQASMVRAA